MSAESPKTKSQRLLVLLTLLALSALIALARLHTFNEPFERDITTYAVIGHELLNGRALYSDLWDHKPPGPYVTFAAAEFAAGYGSLTVYLLGVGAAIATLWAVYRAGASAGVWGGIWAAIFWTILSGDLFLQANQPNTEVFINAFLAWSAALLLAADDGRLGVKRALWVGLLFGLASLYKQIVLAPAGLMLLAHGASRYKATRRWRQCVTETALSVCVIAAVWAVVFSYFAIRGQFASFFEAVFVFNRSYSGDLARNLVSGLRPDHLIPPPLYPWSPFVALALAGVGLSMWLGRRACGMLLMAFLLGTQIAISLPGRFFPHYYQLWIPPLTIAAGWTIGLLGQVGTIGRTWAAHATGSVMALVLLAIELPSYRLPPEEWSRKKYGDVFVESRRMGLELSRILAADESFFEWGSESGLYFYSKESPPSGVFLNAHLGYQEFTDSLLARMMASLTREPPDLFVVFGNHVPSTPNGNRFDMETALFEWFQDRYRFSPAQPIRDRFALFVRKGSKLEARLESVTSPRPP